MNALDNYVRNTSKITIPAMPAIPGKQTTHFPNERMARSAQRIHRRRTTDTGHRQQGRSLFFLFTAMRHCSENNGLAYVNIPLRCADI
jgi:hypothetical protein